MVSGLGLGANSFRWTVSRGVCVAVSDVVVTNNTVVSQAGTNQTVCAESATVEAVSPIQGSGVWSTLGSASIKSPSNRLSVVGGLSSGVNSFTWTVTNSKCVDASTVLVSNNSFVTNAGSDRSVCGTSASLGASLKADETGTWTLASGFGTIALVNSANTSVSNLQLGRSAFQWKVFRNGCYASDIVEVVNDNPSEAQVASSIEVCTSKAQLNATQPLIGQGVWSTLSSAKINSPSLAVTPVESLPSGPSTFRWTVKNNNCSVYSDLLVLNNSVSAVAGNSQFTCGDVGTLTATVPVQGVGSWSVVSGSSTLMSKQIVW